MARRTTGTRGIPRRRPSRKVTPEPRPGERRLLLRAWSVFFLVLGFLHSLIVWQSGPVQDLATRGSAWVTAALLRLIGAGGRADGTLVISDLFSAEIIFECTGVYPAAMLVAAVLAYPASWSARLQGVALGVPLLLAVNQVRIVNLCWIGHHYPAHFETAHLIVWQALIILATVLIWMLWAARIADRDEPRAA